MPSPFPFSPPLRGKAEIKAKCKRWLLAKFGYSDNMLKASIERLVPTSQPPLATDSAGLHLNSCATPGSFCGEIFFPLTLHDLPINVKCSYLVSSRALTSVWNRGSACACLF